MYKLGGMSKPIYLLLLVSAAVSISARVESAAPEIVWAVSVTIDSRGKRVTMESDTGRYVLACNPKADGCITPVPKGRYYLFTKDTLWQMPGAKQPINLEWLQDWMVRYPDAENIGLVPVDGGLPSFGMFVLETWSKR
jgi:hypothetical protein